jgi:hypothetical protein
VWFQSHTSGFARKGRALVSCVSTGGIWRRSKDYNHPAVHTLKLVKGLWLFCQSQSENTPWFFINGFQINLAASGALPVFLRVTLLILATTIIMGLMVEWTLPAFDDAFSIVVISGPTTKTDAIIAALLNQTCPAVL